jgi:hypothetical protein
MSHSKPQKHAITNQVLIKQAKCIPHVHSAQKQVEQANLQKFIKSDRERSLWAGNGR